MTQYHGKGLKFCIDQSIGGALIDISAHVVSVDFPRSVDTADSTTAGDADHEFLAGLIGGTITLNLVWDDAAAGSAGPDAIFSALLGGSASASWEFGPSGNASGRVKYTGEANVTAYNVQSGITDAVKATATLQITGAVTRGTF